MATKVLAVSVASKVPPVKMAKTETMVKTVLKAPVASAV